MDLIVSLNRRLGMGVILITHDLSVVAETCSRVAVMYLGQIVEIGPRRAVFENPQHAYTRKLMAAVPVADPTRRNRNRPLLTGEIPSPIRAVGDEPHVQALVQVGADHFVARHAIAGMV